LLLSALIVLVLFLLLLSALIVLVLFLLLLGALIVLVVFLLLLGALIVLIFLLLLPALFLALLLFGLSLLFRLAVLFALLVLLRAGKSSGSQKHKRQECCAENSKSFHGCHLGYSLDSGERVRCNVLHSSEISWELVSVSEVLGVPELF
jgi:hypothetical protein